MPLDRRLRVGSLLLVSISLLFALRVAPRVTISVASLRSQRQNARELLSLDTRQCSLSMDTMWFRFNASSSLYERIFDYPGQTDSINMGTPTNSSSETTVAVQSSGGNGPDSTSLDSLVNPGFQQRDGAVEEMKACWCTTAYFQRPMEYCPAKSDTCLVQGYTGPVSCYQTSGADSFVRSFWPVAIFWIIALIYALSCSDSGHSARDLVRRWLCSCGRSQEEVLASDVQRLIQHQPERAAFLYRHAVTRARYRGSRRRRRSGWLRWMRSNNNGVTTEEADPVETGNPDQPAVVFQDVLTLKTKIYTEEAEPSVASDRMEETLSGRQTPTPPTSPRTGRDNSSSWLPAPFRRENITLDEMDDEMEQGVRCAICLMRLENGDLVGDIPCNHMLHKECLKDWLKRKNRCPLCQQQGIARLGPYNPLRHRRREPTSGNTPRTENDFA